MHGNHIEHLLYRSHMNFALISAGIGFWTYCGVFAQSKNCGGRETAVPR
jgi:hypothetical protein